MEIIIIKRKASNEGNYILLEYEFYSKGTHFPICNLWQLFTFLSEDEINQIFYEIKKKYNIPGLKVWKKGESYTFIDVKVKKNKKAIKKVHKKVMHFIKAFLKKLENINEEKNLTNWLWKEKNFTYKLD